MSWIDKKYCQANVLKYNYPNRATLLYILKHDYQTLKNINGKLKISTKTSILLDPKNKNIKFKIIKPLYPWFNIERVKHFKLEEALNS